MFGGMGSGTGGGTGGGTAGGTVRSEWNERNTSFSGSRNELWNDPRNALWNADCEHAYYVRKMCTSGEDSCSIHKSYISTENRRLLAVTSMPKSTALGEERGASNPPGDYVAKKVSSNGRKYSPSPQLISS
jgi:hypothetical protein